MDTIQGRRTPNTLSFLPIYLVEWVFEIKIKVQKMVIFLHILVFVMNYILSFKMQLNILKKLHNISINC